MLVPVSCERWADTVLIFLGGFAVVYVAATLIDLVCSVRRKQKILETMPGPAPLPLIGNLMDIITTPEKFWTLITGMMRIYAPTLRIWLGPTPIVILTDPQDLDHIANNAKFNDKSSWYPLAKSTLGNGLIILNGERWRRHRKAVAPSLHQQVLVHSVEIFHRKALDLAHIHLHRRAESGAVFDILEFCDLLAMQTVCESVLSADVTAQGEALQSFIDETTNAARIVTYRVCKPWLLSDRVFALTKQGRQCLRTETLTNQFIDGIINEKRRQQRTDTSSSGSSKRRSFLAHALADPSVAELMSDEELREEAKAMVVAGQGTVSHSLGFILLMLAMHPHIQIKVHQELDDIFGTDDRDRPVTEVEIPHLIYMELVILETLRLFPVVPIFGRNCPEDTVMPSGHAVPKGAHVLFFNFHTHRNEEWFEKPLEFDPDRFLPERARSRPPLTFAAFSAGARSCIGQRYALMYLKTVLSTLLRRYRVLRAPGDQRTVQDLPLEIGVILNLAGGFPIRITHRAEP